MTAVTYALLAACLLAQTLAAGVIFHERICNNSADFTGLNTKFKSIVVPVEAAQTVDASGAVIAGALVPITWRVLIEGLPTHTVILDFGSTLASPFSISGAPGISSVSGSQVIVCGDPAYPAGSTPGALPCDSMTFGHLLITGFTTDVQGYAPEATVDIRLQNWPGRMGSVRIDQLDGNSQIRRTDYFGYEEQDCSPPGTVSNSVLLPVSTGSSSLIGPGAPSPIRAVSVTTGAPAASTGFCFQSRLGDHSLTIPGVSSGLEVPSLVASAGCEPSLAVFTREFAPTIESTATSVLATNSPPGIRLSRRIDVNVFFWIIVNAGDLDTDGDGVDDIKEADYIASSTEELEDELIAANTIFEANLAGIHLVGDFPLGAKTSSVLTAASGGCGFGTWDTLTEGYKEEGLNVYFSSAASNESCNSNRKVIYIRETFPSILAHEIGHAFGLTPAEEGGHVNLFSATDAAYGHGFGNNNVMWDENTDSVIRDQLTIGQVYRMHSHRNSVLFDLVGGSQSAMRTCYPRDRGPRCPPLKLDVFKP